jgi:uncharacterized protein (DUF952 family)
MTIRFDAPRTILHIALPSDWDRARPTGEYAISTRRVTLADEGFIHCSYPHQVEGVANRFYADVDHLVLLQIDIDALRSVVVDEPPFAGSPDRFPHIYGPITVDAVVATHEWRRHDGAGWVLPSRSATDR